MLFSFVYILPLFNFNTVLSYNYIAYKFFSLQIIIFCFFINIFFQSIKLINTLFALKGIYLLMSDYFSSY